MPFFNTISSSNFLTHQIKSKPPMVLLRTSIITKFQSSKFQYFLSTSIKTILHPKTNEKSTTLSLIKLENNPERILQICRTAELTPKNHFDRISYELAISKLKKNQNFDAIRRLVNESLTRPHLRYERVISHFIVLYGKAGLVQDAVKLFEEMSELGIERNVKTLNALLYSCGLGGEYGIMKRVFEEFPEKYGLVRDLDTYNTFLKGWLSGGDGDLVCMMSVVWKMERNGVRMNVTTFSALMGAFYANGRFEEVEKLVAKMKERGIVTGIGFYNDVILYLCKVRKSVVAKGLLDKILAEGMKPNSETYKHFISGFCLEGNLVEAKSLFNDMEEWGLRPEGECYFTLVHYLCEGRDFEAALGICKKCMGKGWFPKFSTMVALVNGLVSVGKVDEAREIIGEVMEFFPKNADQWREIEERLPEL